MCATMKYIFCVFSILLIHIHIFLPLVICLSHGTLHGAVRTALEYRITYFPETYRRLYPSIKETLPKDKGGKTTQHGVHISIDSSSAQASKSWPPLITDIYLCSMTSTWKFPMQQQGQFPHVLI